MKRFLSFFLACLIALSAIPAFAGDGDAQQSAGQAQVQTPGGSLNQRKQADTSSPLVQRIPNKSTVTLLEDPGDTWTKVSYKGKSGYVQTVYLNLAKTAEGKTVYAENTGLIYVRSKPETDGPIISVLDNFCELNVLSVEGDWAEITSTIGTGETVQGYIHSSRIVNQLALPDFTRIDYYYMNETGVMRKNQPLYASPYTGSSILITLPKGHTVTLLTVEGDWCRVRADSTMLGYIPVSSVTLTGEKAPVVDHLANYTAVYYTCTVTGGILHTYAAPDGEAGSSYYIADEVIPVLLLGTDVNGRSWSKITYQGGTYWTPTEYLVISDEPQTMYYPEPIRQTTAGVIFAGDNGATIYENGSRFTDKVGFIPAGTEVQGYLGVEWVIVTYNGVYGYVFYDEIITGLAEVENGDWYYWQHLTDPAPTPLPTPVQDESLHISRDAARKAADQALASSVAGFSAKDLDVRSDKALNSTRSTNAVWEFAYFDGDKYLYAVIIDAVTGECLYTADYSDFAQTVSHSTAKPAATDRPGEISKSKARSVADDTLRAAYGSFSGDYTVVNEYFESVPDYDEPVYRLNYYRGDDHYFTCFIGAKSGKALYHTDVWDPGNSEIDYSTPTPAPTYDVTEDIGESAARDIAERTLSGKYPEFSSQTFSDVRSQYITESHGFENPHYQFDYFVNGQLAYEIIVHAWTGKVLYTFGSIPGEGNG